MNVSIDFVNEHASDDNYADPYEKAYDPVDSNNADRVLSGSDEYDGYGEEVQDKIDELINTKVGDHDNPYKDYSEMKDAADSVLDENKTAAKDRLDGWVENAIEQIIEGWTI